MSKSADNPYPGARAFRQADQDHFHGRDREADEVIRLWKANRLTVVTGPVGPARAQPVHPRAIAVMGA